MLGDKFDKGFAHRVKAVRRKPGSTAQLNEMFVTLRGERYPLWRAVDEHAVELDILLQKRRDKVRAGQRAAAIMSLVRSAQLNGHDPYANLKDVLTRLPTQRADKIAELLPHNWVPPVP
jgi:IS66 C-terminal element/DDE domain